MDLVEINDLYFEAAQAGLRLAPDALSLEPPIGGGAALVPDQAALGGDDHLVPPPSNGPADDLFRVSQAIDGGGIYPVDAQIKGAADGGNGLAVILRTPAVSPPTAADGPRAQPHRRQVQVSIPKFACLHLLAPCL